MEVDFQVIKRYLERKERIGDKDQIIDWFSDLRFEKDIRTKYHQIWDGLSEPMDMGECDGSVILGRIYRKIKNDEYKELPRKKGMTRILNVMSKFAAVLFIPLAAYLFVQKANDIPGSTNPSYSQIYSPLGTRTMFSLPDGSTGWLNGGSYLKFPTEFKGKSREVLLEGEAYFDIISNDRKPFIVNGNQRQVVAHGTAFNIHAYPEDPEIQITLVNGSVSIFERKNGRMMELADLEPGQMYICYPGTRLNRIETVDVNKVAAWKDGKLSFRDESFDDVVRRINRWYNVDIEIVDETLHSYSYQATFVDETLDEVLKLLQHSAPIEFKDLGRVKNADGSFEKRKIELYYKRK